MIHLRCTHSPEDKEEEVADDKEKKELYKKKKKQIDSGYEYCLMNQWIMMWLTIESRHHHHEIFLK